ncbi:hypothetical protein [Cloacibacillus evryensis]|nr:hypothetical protein [Cloacibacillus evryensis]
MEQIAESAFFYHHVAPNLEAAYAVFWLGIFGLIGVLAMIVKEVQK